MEAATEVVLGAMTEVKASKLGVRLTTLGVASNLMWMRGLEIEEILGLVPIPPQRVLQQGPRRLWIPRMELIGLTQRHRAEARNNNVTTTNTVVAVHILGRQLHRLRLQCSLAVTDTETAIPSRHSLDHVWR